MLALDLVASTMLAFATGLAVAVGNAGSAAVSALLLGIFLDQLARRLGRRYR